MKCEKILDVLDGFLEESLTDLEMEAVRTHVEECESCRAELEQRRMLMNELGHLDDGINAPEGLLKQTAQRIHNERRPRRRAVCWIGGGIAAALCVSVGVMSLLGGGMNKSAVTMDMAAADTAGASWSADRMYAEENGTEIFMDGAADVEYIEEPAESAPESETGFGVSLNARNVEQDDSGEYGLKIIREAHIELQTENYAQDVERIRDLVEEFNGFITSFTEDGSEAYSERYKGNRWCDLTIRVPSEQLDAFLERFDGIGIVVFTGIDETDVTAQYVDTDRKLKAYQKQYDRVLEMMDRAETVEDLISIESELSRLEMQIEDAQGTLNYWDSRVNLSTVTVYVSEVRRAVAVTENPTLWERMSAALSDSWYGFTEEAKDTLVNLYAALPYIVTWIVVLGAITVVVTVIVRRHRRKTR